MARLTHKHPCFLIKHRQDKCFCRSPDPAPNLQANSSVDTTIRSAASCPLGNIVGRAALWLSVAAGLVAATQLHGPYLARVRGPGMIGPVFGGLVILGVGRRRRKRSQRGWLGLVTAGIALVAVPSGLERIHQIGRWAVLAVRAGHLGRS